MTGHSTQRKSKELLTTLLICITLAACSNPRDTPLPTDVSQMESIKSTVEKLPEEDRKLLVGYLMRRSMGGIFAGLNKDALPTTATTIGQAIDQQKAFLDVQRVKDAEQKAAADKLNAEREATLSALRSIVSVSLISKSVDSERGSSGIELDRKLFVKFRFTNNGTKGIAGVKGLVIALDQFGDTLSRFGISNDETIGVGKSADWSGERSVKYSFGNNKDEKFSELPADKFKLQWEPETIIFIDGTKVGK